MTSPPPTPPVSTPPTRQGGASAVALLLVGALIGGLAGGVGSTFVAREQPAPTAEPRGSPSDAAPQVLQVTVQESSAVVDAVRDVLPAVVTVVNKRSNGQPLSSGSGVIIDQARGYVVTNSHVVEEVRSTQPSRDFDVILFDGKKFPATVVGNDPETDVAVLRVQGTLAAQATFADSAQVPLGAQVVAIGSPGSAVGLFQNTVTSGIVSAKGRRLPRSDLRDIFLEDLIQTDAAINPGNSGGPLVWVATKQVVGLNALVVRPSGEEGLGFAISSNTVKKISDELIAKGRVVRGLLGISYDDNNPQYASFHSLPTSKGVVVLSVRPGLPAASAGLRPQDLITKLNDQVIDETHPVRTLLLNFRPGDRVILTFIREGREQTVTLTLAQPTSEVDGA